MSTSHYSHPYRGPQPVRNVRRWSVAKLAILGALFAADLAAVITADNLGESLVFTALMVSTLWAINWTR